GGFTQNARTTLIINRPDGEVEGFWRVRPLAALPLFSTPLPHRGEERQQLLPLSVPRRGPGEELCLTVQRTRRPALRSCGGLTASLVCSVLPVGNAPGPCQPLPSQHRFCWECRVPQPGTCVHFGSPFPLRRYPDVPGRGSTTVGVLHTQSAGVLAEADPFLRRRAANRPRRPDPINPVTSVAGSGAFCCPPGGVVGGGVFGGGVVGGGVFGGGLSGGVGITTGGGVVISG